MPLIGSHLLVGFCHFWSYYISGVYSDTQYSMLQYRYISLITSYFPN